MQLPLYVKKIWLFQKPVDFRKGVQGLITLIRNEQKNPTEGFYIFYNKSRDKLKGLCWHKSGFLLIWKELEKGRFTLSEKKDGHICLSEEEFHWLMAGFSWEKMSHWGLHSFQKFS